VFADVCEDKPYLPENNSRLEWKENANNNQHEVHYTGKDGKQYLAYPTHTNSSFFKHKIFEMFCHKAHLQIQSDKK